MLPVKPKAGSFYLLPKVHKKFDKIPKGRPIIPGCGSNTEILSWFCDQALKDSVKEQESYIQDTPDLLRFCEEVNENGTLPEETKPVAIDLKSMYTNIPIQEGLEAFREELDKRTDKSIPTDFYIKLLELVLKSNIFEFDREYFIQLLGTAMGTRVAPTYANIFMAKLEKFMLSNCPEDLKKFIHCWKRYIDDVLLFFSGTYADLDRFHAHLNSVHHTMKFDNYEHNKENNSCNFLDLTIKISNGKITTDLYKKETDKPTALLPSSAHPSHIAKNIVYSMGFRLLRICSTPEMFENRLEELKTDFLKPRNYRSKLIDEQFMKIKDLPGNSYKEKRDNALRKVEKTDKNSDRVIMPIDFNPHMPRASEVLQKHHKAMLFANPNLKEIYPDPPMPALRQPKNLRRILCRSKLHPITRSTRVKRNTHKQAAGWKRCNKPCKVCPYTMDQNNQVTGLASGYNHQITDSLSCDTTNCVYYWRCIKPNCSDYPRCEYVGMTTRQFKDRLAEHRDYPKRDVLTEPSGEHFNHPGHGVHHLRGQAIEKGPIWTKG